MIATKYDVTQKTEKEFNVSFEKGYKVFLFYEMITRHTTYKLQINGEWDHNFTTDSLYALVEYAKSFGAIS